MKAIFYIKPANSSFIVIDQVILEKQYKVISYLLKGKKDGFLYVFTMVRLVVSIMVNAFRTDAFITWFADYHAAVMTFLGRLLNKKVIIFLGGQETISYPELNKGVYLKKFRGTCVKYAIRHADHLIPNHESLIWHENFYYLPMGKKDGIRYYIPDFNTPYTVIPNGTDTEKYFRNHDIVKNSSEVLTVGTMNNLHDFINKGFDLFTELARRNPALKFTMAGINPVLLEALEEKYKFKQIPNLEVLLFSDSSVLFQLYNRAYVFVQASITEGMPNTLAEAMLCECIPVGSRVNGIPDLIGDTGIIMDSRSVELLESSVKQAMKLDIGQQASERIRTRYAYVMREQQIHHLFLSLM